MTMAIRTWRCAVIAPEGQTAVYRGAIPGGAAVTLQASVGDVVDNGDGTWSWSYNTQHGPEESQAVTLTATNGAGLESTVVFNLVISNVAPVVTAAPDQSCERGLPTDFVLGSFIDPGDDHPWKVDIDWGDGSAVEGFLAPGYRAAGSWLPHLRRYRPLRRDRDRSRRGRFRGAWIGQFRGHGGGPHAATQYRWLRVCGRQQQRTEGRRRDRTA